MGTSHTAGGWKNFSRGEINYETSQLAALWSAAAVAIPLPCTVQPKVKMLFNEVETPKIASFRGRSVPPSEKWFPGSSQVYIPNGISTGSAIFAELKGVTNRQADKQDK